MKDFSKVATRESIDKAISSLKKNGIEAVFVADGEAARKKVFEIIPNGAEVMNMTSVTLDTLGIAREINESGKYDSNRSKLYDKDLPSKQKKIWGAVPQYAVGSIHAVTEDGSIIIASNTGSQLPAYAYGADHVIWVVGAQKVVKNFDEGLKRVYEHTLPLESERAKKAYSVPGSFVSKLLVINREVTPGRLTVIIIGQAIGF